MERVGQVLVETYRVERLVAEGGMAAVYEAGHMRVPKRFAVKFLRQQLADHAEALARFRREAEIIATLEHPNIVQLVDYNVSDDGVPYIVLEFLDGEDLATRMARKGRIPLQATLEIARDVAAALEAAHARDVTHRDLKPENIFVTRRGTVKVLDFGVAKLRKAPELTALNVVVGTVGYMSPEQISGKAVDPRTDQFALASIVYAMLAGHPAFEIDGPVIAQATRILTHRPPDIDGVSPAVNAALQRGMAKDPLERYATVGDMVEALIAAAGATMRLELSRELQVVQAVEAPRAQPSQRNGTSDDDEDVVTAQGDLPPDLEPLPTERTALTQAPPAPVEPVEPIENDPPTDRSALAAEGLPTVESMPVVTAPSMPVVTAPSMPVVTAASMPVVTGEIDSQAAVRTTLPAPVEPSALSNLKTMLVHTHDRPTLPPSAVPPAVRAVLPPADRATVPPADRATLPPSDRPTLPPDGLRAPVPVAERVTLKAQQAPPELEALRARARAGGKTGDSTSKHRLPARHRVAWIVLGAAAGCSVVTIFYLLFTR